MNDQPLKKFPMRMLVLIGSPKLAEKASRIYAESHIRIHYQLRGQGTASSEMMDVLGLGSSTKTVSVSLMPKPFAAATLGRLEDSLNLHKPNSGIAFTTAITGISLPLMKLMDEKMRKEFQQNMDNDLKQMYENSTDCLIMAVVNQGYSELVMDAARQAGASGGTVLHARQVGGEEAMQFWGITLQEEKELILILSKNERKLDIMKALGEQCGIRSEARGIIVATPIDMIAGVGEEGANGDQ